MSSSSGIRAIRQVRRKKSSLSEVKILIVGAPGVGKSALVVRFLTKRYIGEYDHQSDTRYKNEVLVDGKHDYHFLRYLSDRRRSCDI